MVRLCLLIVVFFSVLLRIESQIVLWQKCLGGTAFDNAATYKNTSDGSFIIAGTTRSFDGDLSERNNRADADVWLVKVNAKGKIAWHRFCGGNSTDEANDVEVLKDRGFLVVGFSESAGLTNGKKDVYAARLDMLGKMMWEQHYGGSGNESASCVLELADGGFLIGGETGTQDETFQNKGGLDYYLV